MFLVGLGRLGLAGKIKKHLFLFLNLMALFIFLHKNRNA
jgi:hypothetical protein